jgi:sulfite exporter TauE/SafE
MDLFAVLLTGLLAGGVSCAAVQGGLLAALVMRQRHPATTSGSAGHPPATVIRSGASRLADDLTPVAGFLTGKLLSHTVLGLLLGAVGATMQLSVTVRTMAQIAAGVLVIVFGLAQLKAPGFRGLVVEPPATWSRFVRGRARSGSAFAPAVLGVVSILIPCGVTLSVEALALTSGSPVRGAAIMAVYVIGTAPLFTVLGYLARKAAGAWRGRLAAATGLVVLAMGVYTLNGGLELSGSPLAASRLAEAAGFGPAPVTVAAAPDDAPPVSMTADGTQLVSCA